MIQTASLASDIDGSGPLLVAVHGLTEDRSFWDRVPLADHFRTVRVDLRGHGESPRVAPYDPVTLAGDVHAVLTARGLTERPLIVGHSYGGMVATAYSSRHPVRGVVNIDQTLDVRPTPAPVATAVRGADFAEFMTSVFTRMSGELDPAVTAELQQRRKIRQDVVLGVWTPLLDLGPDELTAFVADMVPAAPTPYLSLHGSPVDDGYAAWLSERIPGAVVESAPVSTHYPHLADPAWFLDRLITFDKGLD